MVKVHATYLLEELLHIYLVYYRRGCLVYYRKCCNVIAIHEVVFPQTLDPMQRIVEDSQSL